MSKRAKGTKGSMNDYRFQVRRNRHYSGMDYPISGDFSARTGQGAASWIPMTYDYPYDPIESDWGGTIGSSLMVIGGAVAAIALVTYLISKSNVPENLNNIL